MFFTFVVTQSDMVGEVLRIITNMVDINQYKWLPKVKGEETRKVNLPLPYSTLWNGSMHKLSHNLYAGIKAGFSSWDRPPKDGPLPMMEKSCFSFDGHQVISQQTAKMDETRLPS